jgi:p-hydroxybenzoate 3-monooxygenase
MRTQVGIVGAGPAGLLLSHLLHLEGIDSIVIECRSREYIEHRVRAGVLEQGSADLLTAAGVGERMKREGLVHTGIQLLFRRRRHRIDFHRLTGGRSITVYGQQEIVKDLLAARLAVAGEIIFDASEVRIDGFLNDRPTIRFRDHSGQRELRCDFIAGCDGDHGICRASIPDGLITRYEQTYPFAWLGILAQAPPPSEELIYSNHERGFALASMRSSTLSRLYLQCAPDESLANWPDHRIWEELQTRLADDSGLRLAEGAVLQKGITPMRASVCEPMQCGALFLAGDSAHIVPPTGAKGMNLALADACILSRGLAAWYRSGGKEQLAQYSHTCLPRIWRAQHFASWMTSMLHRFEAVNGFEYRRQLAELDNVVESPAAAAHLAENYVGFALAASTRA